MWIGIASKDIQTGVVSHSTEFTTEHGDLMFVKTDQHLEML